MLGYLTKAIHCFKTKNIYKMDFFIIQSCKTENKFLQGVLQFNTKHLYL